VILYQGNDQWFFLDDWDFLSHRSATSFHDLVAPHGQHWTTLPILVYRALWWAVGIRHYWPYQLVLIVAHLGAAVLLRIIMRRAGVDAWIATAAASLFVLLGAGREDIVFAFQITFTGALALGLAHIVLADHQGPMNRRDLLGVICGVLALMFSGVGITMAVAVAVSTTIRRGWKVAAAHTAPVAAAFVVWWAAFARDVFKGAKASPGDTVAFLRDAITTVFGRMGDVPGMGWILAAVLIAGLALRWQRLSWTDFRKLDGPSVGLASAAFFFAASTGYGRAVGTSGIGSPSASRYVHILAALLLPAVALAASEFADRWRVALPLAVALFLVGLPGNVAALRASGTDKLTLGDPNTVLTMARLPLAQQVPRSYEPMPFDTFSIGWLLDGVASGRVPISPDDDAAVKAAATQFLTFKQLPSRPGGTCTPVPQGQPVRVDTGQRIEFDSAAVTLLRPDSGAVVGRFAAANGRSIGIVAGPMTLQIVTSPADRPVRLCQ
jgi:hypothetical protein